MSLRWGILGASSKIYRKALLPVLSESPLHEVVAEASRAGSDESPYGDVLLRSDVDAIYIPLPNHLHTPWIVRALEAGKHVLCEKPLTLTLAESDEIFAAAEVSGKWLIEAYTWPHHPRSQQVLALAASGELGDLRTCRGAFSFLLADHSDHRADRRGDGAMLDIGIYAFAPAMLLAGRDIDNAWATAHRNAAGVDLSMSGLLDFGQNFTANFDVSFEMAFRRLFEVTGTKGIIAYPDATVPMPGETGTFDLVRNDGAIEKVSYEPTNAYRRMVDQFAAVVAGNEAPRFTPADSQRLARIQEALRQASGY
jgi:D-xylose 1-dehydrogenase (NADP+, D-xylono-1,5-lactone-forming)